MKKSQGVGPRLNTSDLMRRSPMQDQSTTENWRPVVGYEGLYEVSDHGRIKSLPRAVFRSNGHIHHVHEKVMKPHLTSKYPNIQLCRDGKRKIFRIHVIVLTAFSGPKPLGLIARHLDGNRRNNCISNLVWGTHKENCEDQHRLGEIRLGERRPNAKLTEKAVREIHARTQLGESQYSLAREFGVCQQSISQAVTGKRWKHCLASYSQPRAIGEGR